MTLLVKLCVATGLSGKFALSSYQRLVALDSNKDSLKEPCGKISR